MNGDRTWCIVRRNCMIAITSDYIPIIVKFDQTQVRGVPIFPFKVSVRKVYSAINSCLNKYSIVIASQ